MRVQYSYTTNTHVVFCNGCMGTLILVGAPGLDVEQAILERGWDADPEGILCPKCAKLAEQQASFKGIL